jgi:hypothetical protein
MTNELRQDLMRDLMRDTELHVENLSAFKELQRLRQSVKNLDRFNEAGLRMLQTSRESGGSDYNPAPQAGFNAKSSAGKSDWDSVIENHALRIHALAEQTKDPIAKGILLRLAHRCDEIAEKLRPLSDG